MIRAVVDTNVFVSGVLGGQLADVLAAWQAGRFILIVSDEVVLEYLEVLRRPKFNLPLEVIENIGVYLFRRAVFVTPSERLSVVVADPKDNKFVEAAVAGEAAVIVSGDKHLLNLSVYGAIHVITARDFLTRLDHSERSNE